MKHSSDIGGVDTNGGDDTNCVNGDSKVDCGDDLGGGDGDDNDNSDLDDDVGVKTNIGKDANCDDD